MLYLVSKKHRSLTVQVLTAPEETEVNSQKETLDSTLKPSDQ